MKKLLLAAALGAFSCAQADNHDGNALLAQCGHAVRGADGKPILNDMLASACVFYIQGVVQANSMFHAYLTSQGEPPYFCSPEGGIGNRQAVRTVHSYLKKHSRRLAQPRAVLTIEAFREAFPCPK